MSDFVRVQVTLITSLPSKEGDDHIVCVGSGGVFFQTRLYLHGIPHTRTASPPSCHASSHIAVAARTGQGTGGGGGVLVLADSAASEAPCLLKWGL